MCFENYDGKQVGFERVKVAVCLVVKNEAVEIPYWIAWYKALGFDSFLIYDDFSDDATEAVILSMCDGLDIRFMRNAVNRDLHNIRQVRAYNDAVARYGREFDWIALFDADEYLDLYGADIKTSLEQKKDASLVAYNWSCVGTNGFVSRPSGPPFLNYTMHGRPDLYWNRHTKVIFRPAHLQAPISQVHNVDVSGPGVDAAGRPIEWDSPHGGFTREAPDWSGGKLIHFQSRSMEHYVTRDRNLEDVRRDSGDPLHTVVKDQDYNAISYEISEAYLEKFEIWMRRIVESQARAMQNALRGVSGCTFAQIASLKRKADVAVFNPSYEAAEHEVNSNWISFHDIPGGILKDSFPDSEDWVAFRIDSHFGKRLGSLGGVLSVDDSAEPITGVFCRGGKHVHLFGPEGEALRISGDARRTSILTYQVWRNSDETVSFSHPRTGRYLGFVPDGTYSTRKMRALAWESFILSVIPARECPSSVAQKSALLARYTVSGIAHDISESGDIPGDMIFNLIEIEKEENRKTIGFLSDGMTGEHIF